MYFILSVKYRKNRFDPSVEQQIQADVNSALAPLGMTETTKQKELVGLVSSFMMLEEFSSSNK